VAGGPRGGAAAVLDARKAERELGWRAAWSVAEAVGAAAAWYAGFYRGADSDAMLAHCRADIAAYCAAAAQSGATWADAGAPG
jgi:hypothetical protein